MANYRIKKTLNHEGKTHFRGTETELELPDELEADLIKKGVIALIDTAQNKVMRAKSPESKADETKTQATSIEH
jgi:hypothetical protein